MKDKNYLKFNNFIIGSYRSPDLIIFITYKKENLSKFLSILNSIDRSSLAVSSHNVNNCTVKRYSYYHISLKTISSILINPRKKSDFINAYTCYALSYLYHLGMSGVLEDKGLNFEYFFQKKKNKSRLPHIELGIYLNHKNLFPYWALYQDKIHLGLSRNTILNRARDLAKEWQKRMELVK